MNGQAESALCRSPFAGRTWSNQSNLPYRLLPLEVCRSSFGWDKYTVIDPDPGERSTSFEAGGSRFLSELGVEG